VVLPVYGIALTAARLNQADDEQPNEKTAQEQL